MEPLHSTLWTIENPLHWIRDDPFAKTTAKSTVAQAHKPWPLAAMRYTEQPQRTLQLMGETAL